MEKKFVKFCKENNYQQNSQQLEIVKSIKKFLEIRKSFFNFLTKKEKKLCYYLFGGVGVGKTMILNFIYSQLKLKKKRMHFNEFMISFHDYRHKKQDTKSIHSFVKNLGKYKLIYLDEFQVTNIVDAMILGKLFELIFNKGIKVFITSNIKVDELYKDGLQREQFIPFIKIIKKRSIVKELKLEKDYRKLNSNVLERAFYPINERTLFKINKIFRELTKNKQKKIIKINIKGRILKIANYFEGIARVKFKTLCDKNLGAEDYLAISKVCNLLIIEDIPRFDDVNSNQQNRFITLIDILYDKKIPVLISSETNISNLGSSKRLRHVFQRTLSRLYELTSPNMKIN